MWIINTKVKEDTATVKADTMLINICGQEGHSSQVKSLEAPKLSTSPCAYCLISLMTTSYF